VGKPAGGRRREPYRRRCFRVSCWAFTTCSRAGSGSLLNRAVILVKVFSIPSNRASIFLIRGSSIGNLSVETRRRARMACGARFSGCFTARRGSCHRVHPPLRRSLHGAGNRVQRSVDARSLTTTTVESQNVLRGAIPVADEIKPSNVWTRTLDLW